MSFHHYGYGGHSKPQINYHQQNSEYVTTVIEEMSRMTVNQKPCYGGGGDLQKTKVCKEEAIEEKKGGYHNGYGDAAVQKHEAYKHEAFEEKKNSGYHSSGGGSAVQKLACNKQEAFEENAAANCYDVYYNKGGAGGGVKQINKHEYHHEEAFDGGCSDVGGYSSLHHGGAAAVKQSKHAGYQHGAYGESRYAASHHGGGGDMMHKYGYQKEAYGKVDASGGYGGGYAYGGGAKTKIDAFKQPGAYGGAITGAVQQHGYYQDAYDEADAAAGYGGGAYYGAGGGGAVQAYGGGYKQKGGYGYGGGAMQKYGYGHEQGMYGGKTAAGAYHGGSGYAAKTEFAGGHHVHGGYGSESDCEGSDDESDCEEAFGHGGVHSYEAYKRAEKHGGGNLGGVRRYESYERHENLGGGHHYEAYESTTHEGYTAGGAGYGACAPPKKCFLY